MGSRAAVLSQRGRFAVERGDRCSGTALWRVEGAPLSQLRGRRVAARTHAHRLALHSIDCLEEDVSQLPVHGDKALRIIQRGDPQPQRLKPLR